MRNYSVFSQQRRKEDDWRKSENSKERKEEDRNWFLEISSGGRGIGEIG